MISKTFPMALGALMMAVAGIQGAAAQVLDQIVAVVNEEAVLASELRQFVAGVKAQLRAQGTTPPSESVLLRQALERLVLNKIQQQRAEATGIRVDDETLNRAVRSIAQRNRLSIDQFRRALEADGYDFGQFRESIRQEIMISRLQQRNVDDRLEVSEREIEGFLSNRSPQAQQSLYRVNHILIALPEAASPEQIDQARAEAESVLDDLRGGADFRQTAVAVSDGQKALEGGDLGWFKGDELPAVFAEPVQAMEPGEVSDVLRSSSGFHLVQLAERKGETRHLVSQARLRHILIRTNELVTDDDARARLEQLRERVIGGDDFASLAQAHSDDTLSARKGGELGWVNPDDLEPQLTREVTSLEEGEMSEPVKSEFGWHLVQVLERRQHDDTDEFRRANAKTQIRARKRQEALQLWLRQLRDEAYVDYRLDS